MTDLRTTYLGLELASPLVASASPLAGDVESLLRLEAAGAAAVVLPSLFGEQVALDAALAARADISNLFSEDWGTAVDLEDYNAGPGEYLRLVQRAKRRLRIPVIASLSSSRPVAWNGYPEMLEAAGADAIELNVCSVATDPARDAGQIETEQVELTGALVAATTVPVAVKIGPNHTAPANLARRLEQAGATGLVVFHRLHEPDVDLAERCGVARLELSSHADLPLRLRWLAILRARVAGSLAATGGIWSGEAAAKAVLAGADVVEVASALIEHGPEHLQVLTRELEQALAEAGFVSVAEARGLAALDAEDRLAPGAVRDAYVAALIGATERIRAQAALPGGSPD